MPFEPTQQIREQEADSPLRLNVRPLLNRMAELEPSLDAPYLTLSLDWRAEGSRPELRFGRRYFDTSWEEVLGRYEPHTPEHDSLSADIERIRGYLDGDIPVEAQGVVIVACHASGVWAAVPLGVPVENRIVTGPTPGMALLGQIADDYSTYAVLQIDRHDAFLTFVTQSTPSGGVALTSDDWPRRQQTGGFSQQRLSRREEEQTEAFVKDVAEETRKAMNEHDIDLLVLACEDEMKSIVEGELHESIREKIAGHIHLDIRAGETDLIAATLPVVALAERKQEQDTVQRVQDFRGPGGRAVTGAEDVLAALQGGQVMTLVMNEDFHGPGWADFSLPVYGAGKLPKQHPAGGDAGNIVELALEEEIVRLALQTGADLEIVHTDSMVDPGEQGAPIRDAGESMPRAEAAKALDKLGGVGALLRFSLDDDTSTAQM